MSEPRDRHLRTRHCLESVLKEFLEFFNKTGRGVNLTNIALQSGPVSAGEKGSRRKRINAARTTPESYDDKLQQLKTSAATRPSAPKSDTWQNQQVIYKKNTVLVHLLPIKTYPPIVNMMHFEI